MRLAIVGCGDAAGTIGLASRFVPGVRVSVCIDVDSERARRFAARFRGAKSGTDWRVLANADDVDAVYVAVPHALHCEIATRLSSSGMPVLLEKPLAESVESAARLVAGLSDGHRVGVNYQYRYDPKAWALVEASRGGTLGELYYITVDVPWYRGPEYLTRAPWHLSLEASGGGTLLTQGSHALDLAIMCTGSDPVSAMGSTYRRRNVDSEVEDLASGQVDTAGGVPVFVTSSMVARPGFRTVISVFGSRGSAIYRGFSRPSVTGYGVRVRSAPVLTQLHAFRRSLAGFAGWANGGRPYRCPAEESLPVLRAVQAIYESAKVGRRALAQGGHDV